MSIWKGHKFDTGKRAWWLMPLSMFEPAIKVAQYGAKKYLPGNWREVEDIHRYEDALVRHFMEYQDGNRVDHESGLPVLAHLLWNAAVLCWFEKQATPALYAAEAKEPPVKLAEVRQAEIKDLKAKLAAELPEEDRAPTGCVDAVEFVRKSIAKRLKDMRLKAGLDVSDLALKLDETETYVRCIEDGSWSVDERDVPAWEKACGVTKPVSKKPRKR